MSSRRSDERRYEGLSPFEVKNKLIAMAEEGSPQRLMLNAGRGNPNWLALSPRHAFVEMGRFALGEAERALIADGFGHSPAAEGCATRFDALVKDGKDSRGAEALGAYVRYACDTLGLKKEGLIFEFVDAMLGDHYPTPDRMLVNCERIVQAYLAQEMCGGEWPGGAPFDLFATEGGTAAMAYVFNSLMENKLLHKGDTIALGTPIFTPYLEIPQLNDYEFVELDIEEDESEGWRYPASEIAKLADPKVKAFFVVNPSNPTSRAMHPESLEAIGDLVKSKRPDLILLTDDVYGTFVNGFRSLAAAAPKNTILVYSFSKYFGATGWRLGVIGLHPDNALDAAIQGLKKKDAAALVERYHEVFVDAAGAKLIDRMVADSRTVALHHTAGLSTPQQVMMSLFALSCLTDEADTYKHAAQQIVMRRLGLLFEALGEETPRDANDAHYYVTIDVPQMAAKRYGDDFARALVKDHESIDFVWRLAEEKGVVLMDGGGFDAPRMSVRVSLANLDDAAYTQIGKAIDALLSEYHDRWQSRTKK